jgi:hypothetical protein
VTNYLFTKGLVSGNIDYARTAGCLTSGRLAGTLPVCQSEASRENIQSLDKTCRGYTPRSSRDKWVCPVVYLMPVTPSVTITANTAVATTPVRIVSALALDS